MNKKQFFKKKIERVQYDTWELEFKLAKSRYIREGVRQDRDRAIEALNNIEAALKAEPTDRKKVEAERDALLENVKRYEAQMDMIDKQINGYEGDDTHEPVIGLIEQLASLAELKSMYKSYK
jgi:septal ring factor EnvC (AmiA/AmiB activator)